MAHQPSKPFVKRVSERIMGCSFVWWEE